jgi:hypothetical protein
MNCKLQLFMLKLRAIGAIGVQSGSDSNFDKFMQLGARDNGLNQRDIALCMPTMIHLVSCWKIHWNAS